MSSLHRGRLLEWVLSVVSLADGNVRILKSLGLRMIGKQVWMPEGNSLVVPVADAAGRGQLWSIDYPSGEMHRFTNDLSNYTLDVDGTRDGRILAGIQSIRAADVWIAPSGDAVQARQLTSGTTFERVAAGPAGKLLLSNGDIRLMDANGGHPSLLVPQAGNIFAISSCGDRYIVFDSYRDNQLQLWRADADGSNGLRLADETVDSDCSSDGKSVFYIVKKNLYRLPIEGGEPSEVLTTPPEAGVEMPRISPDGGLVAVRYQEGSPLPVLKVALVPASGGNLRFVSQLPSGAEGLHWSPDGKGLQYLLTRGGATNVWEQPLTGGDPHQVTKFTSGRIFSFAWSRDGKQLLLSRGNESSDVILISNFR